jgi:hypothetical protein
MRRLEGAFGKQDSVVAENTDRDAGEMRETGDQCRPVKLLELVEI